MSLFSPATCCPAAEAGRRVRGGSLCLLAPCLPVAQRKAACQRITSTTMVPLATTRRLRLARAATSATGAGEDSVVPMVAALKEAAANPGAVQPKQLLQAIIALEKAKLDPEGWLEQLQDPRARWRLVYTAAAGDVQAASKGQAGKGGQYFPLTAVQRFDPKASDFENGIFLGPVGYLTFNGPFEMKQRQLSFDVICMNIGLGPLRFSIPFKAKAQPVAEMEGSERKKLPFFLYAYVDSDIVVARGRSGGLAFWARTTPEWEAEAGVMNVYK